MAELKTLTATKPTARASAPKASATTVERASAAAPRRSRTNKIAVSEPPPSTSRNSALQAAGTQHGEGDCRFEELDRLRPDYPALGRKDEFRKRAAVWRERLRAAPL